MTQQKALRTDIRNASWAVVWDPSSGQHVYRRDVDISFEDDRITSIAPGGSGSGDGPGREIDGRGYLVAPGFIDIHSHLFSEPMLKGLTDEVGSRNFYMSSLYEYLFLFENDVPGSHASCEVALCELLLSGVTTVCDLSVDFDGWIDLLGASGIRAYAAPMFRSGRWFTSNGHEIRYEWDDDKGVAAFEAALDAIERACRHSSGRLSGMICPAQIDTCTADLFEAAAAAARERGLPLQTHAAQSVSEFHEIMRRHGTTPIGWLEKLDVLGPHSIIGHAIFLDHHSWLHWSSSDDLRRIAESGTTIAHCPTVFSRRGISLQDLGAYRRAAVNVGIGTDTFPHNYVEEMRTASIVSRVTSGDAHSARAKDLFAAATINGAKALQRTDIGKLEVGAKADLFMADVTHPAMRPLYDPLRSLIYAAGERAIRHVFVDGRQVVADGRVLTIDHEDASARLEEAQKRSIEKVPQYDWAGRPASELMPLTFAVK